MNKIKPVVFLLAIFQIPVLLLFLNIIKYEHRYFVLAFISSLLIIYTIKNKFSFHELGFGKSIIRKSIIYNFIFSGALTIFLLVLYLFDLIREPTIPDWGFFFTFYVFVSSPIQEFLFRSLVFAKFRRIGLSNSLILLISTLNYGLMHSIYHDWLTFFSATTVGLCLGFIYLKTDNIYGISISHAVVGAVSIYVGLI